MPEGHCLNVCQSAETASCFCPQVVYSSSARELKVETVKPDAPENEDDIDIDAIWETLIIMMMLFLCCGLNRSSLLPSQTQNSPLLCGMT